MLQELQIENAKLRHYIDVLEGKSPPGSEPPAAAASPRVKRTISPKIKAGAMAQPLDNPAADSVASHAKPAVPPAKPLPMPPAMASSPAVPSNAVSAPITIGQRPPARPPPPNPSQRVAGSLSDDEGSSAADSFGANVSASARVGNFTAAASPSWRRLRGVAPAAGQTSGPSSPTSPSPLALAGDALPERSLASSLPSLRGLTSSGGSNGPGGSAASASPTGTLTAADRDALDSQTLLYVSIAKGDLASIEAAEDPDFLFLADGSLKAATLDKLVALLPCNSEPYYLSHFLITYRAFCSPDELFAKLQILWEQVSVSFITSHELELFRIKFMNVLKTWIDKHFYDFGEELLAGAQQFLERHQEEIGALEIQNAFHSSFGAFWLTLLWS